MKRTTGEKWFQILNLFILILIAAVIVLPLFNIISISVSSKEAVTKGTVAFWPKGFNTDAYKMILGNPTYIRSLVNTVFITIVSTCIAIVIMLMVAYSLTREFLGKKFFVYFFVLTMYFSGGLIPTYLVVSKYLNLRNTYWALILPGLLTMFYIIVIRSQIERIPDSILEAAYIDGAGEYRIVFQIVLPLLIPTIAAVCMFIALAKWNSWFGAMIYTDHKEFWTLQYFLRVVVFDKFINAANSTEALEESPVPEENFRMAAIILVAAPIVCIYPFVQKYFVKGIIAGGVKG